MAHALGLRTTSFAASAGLLGLAAIAMLTMPLVQQQLESAGDAPLVTTYVEPPPPPPIERERETNPIRQIGAFVTDMLRMEVPPVADAPATPSEIAVQEVALAPTITDPTWVRRPRDLASYYPRRALERGIEGSVALDCQVARTGRLNCAVVSETPENWGFAEAALRISRDYQMVPAMRDGAAVEARHRMVIPFRLE